MSHFPEEQPEPWVEPVPSPAEWHYDTWADEDNTDELMFLAYGDHIEPSKN